MKKKIMAFLLAATMVVGCATSASAADPKYALDTKTDIINAVKIESVKADYVEKTDATFYLNDAFSFYTETNRNSYTAIWSNKTDATSKSIVDAWRNGNLAKNLTSTQKIYDTLGAWTLDQNAWLNGDYKDYVNPYRYGSWIQDLAWDKEKTTQQNYAALSINNGKFKDKSVFDIFAYDNNNYATFRSGYGVILQDTLNKITAEEAETLASLDKNVIYSTLVSSTNDKVLLSDLADPTKVVAFVKPVVADGSDDETKLVSKEVVVAEVTNSKGVAQKKVAVYNKNWDAAKKEYKTKAITFEVVSPYEALWTQSWTNSNDYFSAYTYGAQAYGRYEVIVGKKSLDDPNFVCNDNLYCAHDIFAAGQFNVADKTGDARFVNIFQWKDQYARQAFIERHASFEAANTEVMAAWRKAVSADMVKAYNAAGADALADDALMGDIYYMDIVKTSGTAGKYTLVSGKLAKALSYDGKEDKTASKAVKVLHWTGSKWEQVKADIVRLGNQIGDDSYGVMLETASYSPYIFMEIVDEGTTADATAEAAKTPEKSGKTGVSFLGL